MASGIGSRKGRTNKKDKYIPRLPMMGFCCFSNLMTSLGENIWLRVVIVDIFLEDLFTLKDCLFD